MTDVGYSSRYEVYLTRSNGMQIVTNELSLTLLAEMRHRQVIPSEAALLLHIPKSTVQGNMGRLLRAGIIAHEECVDDARSAVYRIDAALIFSSEADEEWQKSARSASVARIMRDGRCTSREDLSLYSVSLMESGFNVVHGLSNVGAALVRGMDDPSWWGNLLSSAEELCASKGIRLAVNTEESLKLSFRSDSENISDIPLVIVPMLGALSTHARELFGYDLSSDIHLSIDDDGRSVDIRINPFRGQMFERPTSEFDMRSVSADTQFSVYSIGGMAMLFTNRTMMGILDALFEEDLSLNELEDSLGFPKPTIYASLSKLIELGAVGIGSDSSTPKRYKLTADPILYMTDPDTGSASRMNATIESFQKGELDYYSAVISYALDAIGLMGIRFDKMFMRSGERAATAALDMQSDMDPQGLVDLACTMVSGPDKAEVISYLPISIRLFLSKDTLWDAWPGDFVMGFLREGLRRLLDFDYPIHIEKVNEAEL